MNNKYVKSLLLTVFAASGVLCSADAVKKTAEAEKQEKIQRNIDMTTDAYSVAKQQEEVAALNFIAKGNELFLAGNFKDAAVNYANARLILETLESNSPHFQELLVKTKELIAQSYRNLARNMAQRALEEANSNEIKNAIAYCKEAMVVYPPCKAEMLKQIAEYEKMITATDRNNRLHPAQVIPDLSEKKYQIAVLLKQAKLLYYSKQYMLARERYEEILLIDKTNPEAIQGLRATNVQLTRAGNDRFRNTHKKQMAEAAWEGTSPITKQKTVDVREEFDKNSDKEDFSFIDDDTQLIRKKLREIVLPSVNFSGTADSPGLDLRAAVKFLRDRSKEHDPDKQGVNIYLYFPEEFAETDLEEETEGEKEETEGEEEETEDEEEEETEGEEENSTSSSSSRNIKYPVVNLVQYNQPLIKIIDDLAKAANLKYKIEKNAVILAPKDAKIDDMQIKVYMFDESLVDALGGDPDPESLQKAFKMLPDANIDFPNGSKVMYDPRFRSLIVLNTPENLANINNALIEIRKLNPQPMVQVQVKFVEVEQNDLKELGFIQSLSRSNGDNGKTNGRLQFDENYKINDTGRNTFTYSNSWKGYDYNLVVNAINQLDSKDVLSSPKVLTMPNQKVSIKMTSERYFEWDYEEGEYNVNSENGYTTYSYTPPWPEFEKQELGISMEITPKVDTAKRLIMLDVHPWVTTLVGWTEYEYSVAADEGGASHAETLRRPIVAERTTDTNVVIYDSETVVIGGIIKDYTETVDEKVPVLGDIPLLGNFFKSKSTQVKKTNLLIFVTARMVKPDGTPFFPPDSTDGRAVSGIGDMYGK